MSGGEAKTRLDPRGVGSLLASPWFWIVLALKLVLGCTLASYYLRELFTPFLNYYVESGFSNPWTYFASQGKHNAFPYPPVMLYVLTPFRLLLQPFAQGGVATVSHLHLLAMRAPLLLADVSMALILAKWFPTRVSRVLKYYWCSPFVIYICYWHGQLDVIPTAILLGALFFLRHRRPVLASCLLGLALASKSHIAVAIPLIFVYIHQVHGTGKMFLAGGVLLLTYAGMVAPYLTSPAFASMVYGTEEQARALAFRVPVDAHGTALLLAPGALMILWFRFHAYARTNWDLLMLYLGLIFSTFILFAPPAPGYFLWSLPFLVHYICRLPRFDPAPYICYFVGYLAYYWLGPRSDLFDAWRIAAPSIAGYSTPAQWLQAHHPGIELSVTNLAYTLMQAGLAAMALGMYLFGVRNNVVYRIRTAPMLIGVAGDSAAGKDTFAHLATNLLGRDTVTVVAGDDYHRWPRGHEMWQVHTHLDVRANDLHLQQRHAIALSRGMPVLKGSYDHATGQFTQEEQVDPGQYLVFQGLHTLALENLREICDLKVFLDPQEDLRRLWAVQRDCKERGYRPEDVLARLDRRKDDHVRYVLPQRDLADLIVSMRPVEPLRGFEVDQIPELVLEIRAVNGFDLGSFAKALAARPGMKVEHEPLADARWQQLTLQGHVSAEVLESVCREVVSNLSSIALKPRFEPGLYGCIQAILALCLAQRLPETLQYDA